ncbi:tetratricopeptide repeat protein [Tamlana sp. 2201CG12-4]|uniref:ATP-binding protein n=1 Tax=Tamlana sp. 2201CG12-4 TaxID=3112582 RepID=UPI002DC03271|nr:tetratricopeptide repeat protein [Tamlana sp. 2201CG12-4]MEC3907500.1 tetratricopeptide repeat protein [Tamlana sp. 2201CG12-4]
MKKVISVSLCLIFSLCLAAQTNKIIDSLKVELKYSKADTIISQTLNELAYYYLYENTDSALVYGKKALNKSRAVHDVKTEAKANLYIGNAFLFTNRYDSARFYYKQSYKIFDEKRLDKSAIYSSLGMLYKSEGNYEKAIETYFKGITYDEKNSNEYGKFIKLLNLANVYSIIEDYEKSLEYGFQAEKISKNSENPNINYALGTILNNIGGSYSKLKQYDKALEYFNSSLSVNIKNENRKEIARNYNNIGAIYEKKGEPQKALALLRKALEIRERLKDEDEIVETHLELAICYSKLSKKVLANFHFEKASFHAKKVNDLALLSEVYNAKSEASLANNNFKEALESFKAHSIYRDSILKLENLKNINEIETKYETAKKDNEIATQQLELKGKEAEIQKEKTQNYYMLGTIVFLVVATILLVFLFKQRQKRKNQELLTLKREFQIKTLESLIEGEEKERLRVAKELHDGVNGDLSAIKYKLSSLLEMNNNVIKEAITMIDDSCKQVRAISHNLIPPSLENFNLQEATLIYCGNLNDVTPNLDITFQHLGEAIDLPKKAEVNAFRIIQELVTNAIRHAEASSINVQISSRYNIIQITVEDDGKGFDENNLESDGIGLSNVQSRVAYLNATTDFISNNYGTSYTIDIDKDKLNGN